MSKVANSAHLVVFLWLAFSSAPFCFGQESTVETSLIDTVSPEGVIHEDEAQDPSSRLSERALNVLFTKTNLRLAELELGRALGLNSGNFRVVPRLTIERLRSNLAIANEQFEQAKLDTSEGHEKVRLRHVREKLRIARIDMDAANQLKELSSISDMEYKRVELKLDLAKLNLALLQHPTGYMTLVDGLQRQVDRLGVEILALDQRVSKLEGSELTR